MAGLSIALEGLDGCGKGTQVDLLRAYLARAHSGLEVLWLREPGATPLGEQVRDLLLRGHDMGPLAEMLLYMAARAELYEREVAPALKRGALVVLDRSYYSTAAYQGAGLGLDQSRILQLAQWVTLGHPPDRVLLLRLNAGEAAGRLRSAGADHDRIESRDSLYFERVAAGFDAMAAADPARFVVIDASRPPEAVFHELKAAVDALL